MKFLYLKYSFMSNITKFDYEREPFFWPGLISGPQPWAANPFKPDTPDTREWERGEKLSTKGRKFAATRRKRLKGNEIVLYKNKMVTRYKKPRKYWANPKVPRVYTAMPYKTQGKRTGGFMNLEKKFKDVELAETGLSNFWTTKNPLTGTISGVKIGTGESDRDGRKYTIHSIYMKVVINKTFIPLDFDLNRFEDIIGRIVIVLDTQTNGAQLTATDVFLTGVNNDTFAFRNLQFTDRFRVLWDYPFRLSIANGVMWKNSDAAYAVASVSGEIITYFKKFKGGLIVQCKDVNADVASITNNSLHCLAICSKEGEANISYRARIRFTSG